MTASALTRIALRDFRSYADAGGPSGAVSTPQRWNKRITCSRLDLGAPCGIFLGSFWVLSTPSGGLASEDSAPSTLLGTYTFEFAHDVFDV